MAPPEFCCRSYLADFFGGFGTFAPALRASDNPIAIACFGFVTFFPLLPDVSLPCFIAFISRSTDAPAFGLYFLPLDFFAAFFGAVADFFVAFFFVVAITLSLHLSVKRPN